LRETIQLGEDESIFALRQKLEQVQSGQVAVVVPTGHPAVRTELDLTLLHRAAEALALDMVLVTDDHALTTLARSLGLKTASSRGLLGKRAKLVYRATGGAGSRPRLDSRRPALEAGAAMDRRATGGVAGPSPQRPTWRDAAQHLALLAVAGAALLVLLLGLALALPSATVMLAPKGEKATMQLEVVASTTVQSVDDEKGRVPAHQVQTEIIGMEEGQATGKRSVADRHATGDVVLVNKTTNEVTVPKGTVVRTTDGVTVKFYTLLDVKVPGAYGATARVPIEAAEAGPVGNVDALTIRVVEGAPSYQVDVLNDKPIQGGNEKRVSIVANEDQNRLRASLVQKLQQKAYEELVARLSPGDWIPADSLDVAIADESFDKKVGDEADKLNLTMKVRVTGFAVDGQATRDLLSRALVANSNGGLVVNEATLAVQQPVGTAQVQGDTVRFKASASATLVPAINLKAASSHIAGKDVEAAALWLAQECDLSEPPRIEIRPSWWHRLPWMPSRIQVRLSGGSE